MRPLGSGEPLDQFALLASQEYNLGNSRNWFFNFRGGIFGLVSRLRGLDRHSKALHEWSHAETFYDQDHHLSTMLFCMDSALEHFTFMLNALGQSVDVTAFWDVGDDKALRNIAPKDIHGNGRGKGRSGYEKFFPSVRKLWIENLDLIHLITENHDVTKHRHQANLAGRARSDAPEGFFRSIGLPDDPAYHSLFAPAAEVLLSSHPKLPIGQRPAESGPTSTLEEVESKFRKLIDSSLILAEEDARMNIKLNDSTFRT